MDISRDCEGMPPVAMNFCRSAAEMAQISASPCPKIVCCFVS